MTELDQTNSSGHNIFISDLIEATRGKDQVLKKFISKQLYIKKSPFGIERINKNIDFLKTLDSTQQALIIGRAADFKESNDPSKYFPVILAIFGFIISLYKLLDEFTGTIIFSFMVTLVIAIYFTFLMIRAFSTYPIAVYFHSLVTNIKFEK
ncbi:hypothetical protein AEA09_07240 [Lysinibacillus contaminans]|uniref:Uncharacterized protein n=1 Tax=Lysinibacillus contaminans TaxID=1293441 RepID=A0ABR5K0Z6_9BACI|nr:hypothetical protein [Lysinibacillus contaminans]KOS68370.1 hypothetical protein AEA09_07240 [Lysinibacillus contaminans]